MPQVLRGTAKKIVNCRVDGDLFAGEAVMERAITTAFFTNAPSPPITFCLEDGREITFMVSSDDKYLTVSGYEDGYLVNHVFPSSRVGAYNVSESIKDLGDRNAFRGSIPTMNINETLYEVWASRYRRALCLWFEGGRTICVYPTLREGAPGPECSNSMTQEYLREHLSLWDWMVEGWPGR